MKKLVILLIFVTLLLEGCVRSNEKVGIQKQAEKGSDNQDNEKAIQEVDVKKQAVNKDPENRYGESLTNAITEGDVELVKELLNAGANPDAVSSYPFTIYSHTALGNAFVARIDSDAKYQIAEALLKAGADPNKIVDGDFVTPLEIMAKHYGSPRMLDLMIEYGVDIKNSRYALHDADHNFAMELIKRGADVNSRDKAGETVLMSIAGEARSDDKIMEDRETHQDSRNNHYKKLRKFFIFLLENGADVNLKSDYGWTALSNACGSGASFYIDKLLEHGAADSINIYNKSGFNPLLSVMNSGAMSIKTAIDIVGKLVKHGADINAQTGKDFNNDGGGRSILHLYLDRNRNEDLDSDLGLQSLIDFGVNPNLQNDNGETGLFIPIRELSHVVSDLESGTKFIATKLKLIRILLNAGADVNIRNKQGLTVMHEVRFISANDYKAVIDMFVSHGADLSIRNNEGLTPYEYALQKGNLDVAKYLKKISLQ